MVRLPWRRQFRDVVRRQLALFEQEHHAVIDQARSALRGYHEEADPHLAQLAYAEHDDVSEDIEIALNEMCMTYASRLDAAATHRYLREFDRQARDAYRDLVPHLNLYGRQDYD